MAGIPGIVRRFNRERKALGRLSEVANIVDVYQSGLTDDGEPYIVMPHHPDSLDRRLAGGALGWREAVSVMEPVARAIAVAHEAGVLHLDLKPANVLLDSRGMPHVADFGIAEFLGNTASLSGAMLTPDYSPPERFDDVAPHRGIDVYALGATLFALLAGHPPFAGSVNTSPPAVMKRIINDPVPLDRLPSDVPDDLVALLAAAMEKQPDRRLDGAGRFADALAAVAAGRPIGELTAAGGAAATAAETIDPAEFVDLDSAPASPAPTRRLGPVVAGLLAVVGAVVAFGLLRGDDVEPEVLSAGEEPEVPAAVDDAEDGFFREDTENENDGIPFVERVRTLTINDDTDDKIETTLLQSGGQTISVIEGDTRGELKSNGEYIHLREQDEAYTFGFVADELDATGRILARWNIRVTVASSRDLQLAECPALEMIDLTANVESSSVVVVTWQTNTPATELVRSAPEGDGFRFSNPSGNFYKDFTHRLGDLAWSGIEPLEAGTEYTMTINLTSQCDPTDTVIEEISFRTDN